MSVAFICDHCGRELKANERSIGRRVRCPDCATLIVIPDPKARPEPVDENAEAPLEESIVELEAVDEPPSPAPTAELPAAPRRVIPPPPPPALAPPLPPKATQTTPSETGGDTAFFLAHRKHPEDLIDMTAMVDIVFFLLIFFLVTSLQALEAVMDLPTPQSAEGGAASSRSVADLENDPNFITVRIEDDDSIWVEDTQVFNDQELSVRLRAARRESDGPRSLLVIGDADATHGAAVRVFDAGAGAGVSGISLLVQEKSETGR